MEADKPGFLPEFNAVIVDEAHNLVKSAYDQFKIEWSEKGTTLLLQSVDPAHPRSMRWNNLLQQINEIRPGVIKLRDELQGSVKQVQGSLKDFMQALHDENETRFNPTKQYQEKPILGSINKIYAPVMTELTALKLGLGSIITLLEKIRTFRFAVKIYFRYHGKSLLSVRPD